MGRLQNAFLKRIVKRDNTYDDEQKKVLCSTIDKHGYRGLSFLVNVDKKDIFKLTANEMNEVLKFLDKADPLTLAYTRSLHKAKVLYVAKAFNEIYEENKRIYPERLSPDADKFSPYTEKLFKTFFEITCSIEEMTGRTSGMEIAFDLAQVKQKLIDPYIKDGFKAPGLVSREALDILHTCCIHKINALRLLDSRYSLDQMKIIVNAMLNRVDDETLDKMCNPDLTCKEMYHIAYHISPTLPLNTLVETNDGIKGKIISYAPGSNSYNVQYETEKGFVTEWYSQEQIKPYEPTETKTDTKGLDTLIAKANAISEQAKELSHSLQQHKTEMEH